MSRCSKLRLPHKLDSLCIDFNFSVETFDFVAFHHTKRTNICTLHSVRYMACRP